MVPRGITHWDITEKLKKELLEKNPTYSGKHWEALLKEFLEALVKNGISEETFEEVFDWKNYQKNFQSKFCKISYELLKKLQKKFS